MSVTRKIIIIFIFYRLLSSIIHSIFEIYSKLCYIFTPKEKCCELLQIIYRQNILPTDLTRPKVNFIFIHKSFSTPEVLKSPYWSLYGIDETHAYFVKLPKHIEEYNAQKAPFFYMAQFSEANQMSRMTLEDFCAFGNKLQKPPGPVLYFSNTPRSGSTLLCQMLQTADDWCVFGELDIFTLLPILYHEGRLPDPLYDSLIKASFKIMCKNQKPDQTYVFKTQSNGTRLLPDIIRLLPNVKHLFSWWNNGSKCLNSICKMLIGNSGSNFYMPIWYIWPAFGEWLIGFTRQEGDIMHRVKPRDTQERGYILYSTPYSVYYKAKETTNIIYVEFENLIEKPTEELTRIFNEFEINLKFLPDAINCLKTDSQRNTNLSREKMGTIATEDSTKEEKLKKYNEIDKILGLENVEFWH